MASLKHSISVEESKRIHDLATKIAFQLSFCGPTQTELFRGELKNHTNILGFNSERATQVIEDMMWEFLLKDESFLKQSGIS